MSFGKLNRTNRVFAGSLAVLAMFALVVSPADAGKKNGNGNGGGNGRGGSGGNRLRSSGGNTGGNAFKNSGGGGGNKAMKALSSGGNSGGNSGFGKSLNKGPSNNGGGAARKLGTAGGGNGGGNFGGNKPGGSSLLGKSNKGVGNLGSLGNGQGSNSKFDKPKFDKARLGSSIGKKNDDTSSGIVGKLNGIGRGNSGKGLGGKIGGNFDKVGGDLKLKGNKIGTNGLGSSQGGKLGNSAIFDRLKGNGNGNAGKGLADKIGGGKGNGIGKVGDARISDKIGGKGLDGLKLGGRKLGDAKIGDAKIGDFGKGARFAEGINKIGKNGLLGGKDGAKGDFSKGIKDLVGKGGRNNKFVDELKGGKFDRLVDSKIGKKFDLDKQLRHKDKGDIARRLGIGKHLTKHDFRKHCGKIWDVQKFCANSFSYCYPGPSWCPDVCWQPNWCGWVDWCWWDHCNPICDPRPIFCQPICWDPCVSWTYWHYPVWYDLPVVACGTWVDVEPVVIDAGLDLQLLAARFVDPGHPEQQLGTRLRIWVRNNSNADIEAPFNVLLMASLDRVPAEGLPQAGVTVERIAAGEIMPLDIRLPFEANVMNVGPEGQQTPFEFLHVLVDSHQQIPEAFEENNGAVLARGDVLPVDPAAFAAESEAAEAGSLLSIAGEGFGPEPGQVFVIVNGMELEGKIHGWYDLGVQIELPKLPLVDAAQADIVVLRADGAAANPVQIAMLPVAAVAGLPAPPLE